MKDQQSFRILTVCTGNICRSPAAERLLAARLGSSVTVSSAGTAALVGEPIDPLMAELVAAAGADPSGFAARQVTAALLQEADLILALTLEHRARIVDLAPGVVRRTYTLLEFARLIGAVEPARIPGDLPGERLRAAAPLAAAMRPLIRRQAGVSDDVPDPFRLGLADFERSLWLIRDAVEVISAVAQP